MVAVHTDLKEYYADSVFLSNQVGLSLLRVKGK